MPSVVSRFFNFVDHHQGSIGSLATLTGTIAIVVGGLFFIGYALPQSGIGAMSSLPTGISITVLGVMVGGIGFALLCLKGKANIKEHRQLKKDEHAWKTRLPPLLEDINLEEIEHRDNVIDFKTFKALRDYNSQEVSDFVKKMDEMISDENKQKEIAFKFTISSEDEEEEILGYFYVNDESQENKWIMYLKTPASLVLRSDSATQNTFLMNEGWNRFTYSVLDEGQVYISCGGVYGCSKPLKFTI